jgi:tripartite-type tricarboxylate transporter receptor subunit TctC
MAAGRSFIALAAALIAALIAACATPSSAADWPARSVRILVGFSPGGSADQFGRLIAEELSTTFGQQFYIENRPGSSGTIAASLTARSAPDGYTLMIGGSGPHITSPAINPNIGYDPIADFTHIAMIGADSFTLIGSPALGVRDLKGLVQLGHDQNAPLTFSSPGPGSLGELMMLQFAHQAGIELVHVPAPNSGLMEVLGNHINMSMTGLLTSSAQIKVGKVIALAVSSTERNPVFTDIPTFTEQGHPEVHGDTWFWLTAPKNLPPDIVDTLNREVRRILKTPKMLEYFKEHAALSMDVDAAGLNKFLIGEVTYWGGLAKSVGLSVQ